MKFGPLIFSGTLLAFACAGVPPYSGQARAQVFDFGQIDSFESFGSGTQAGGSPPKTVVDDNERHTVFFTIFDSNTQAKIYWKSSGESRTTTMSGTGVKAFHTDGLFRIEAVGDDSKSFRYGYVLFRLKQGSGSDDEGRI